MQRLTKHKQPKSPVVLATIFVLVESYCSKVRTFLLVDLRNFFSDLGSGDEKKIKKKNSENDQLTGHFQSFFFSKYFQLFF